MTAVILDASAGVEWVLRSDAGERVELAVAGHAIWVPEHYYVETAATLRRLQRAGEVSAERSSVALSRLLSIPTHRAQVRPLLSEAWALLHNITVADALYVVMAKHLHATLITLDVSLANAPALGIATLVP